MKHLLKSLLITMVLATGPVIAQQAQQFGDYVVHYNALNTSLLTPEVAKAYGIRRSNSRALINISVLQSVDDLPAAAVKAEVTASGRNLTGQIRNIAMREINDGGGAIYYIGELPVRNMETFSFTVTVLPEGRDRPVKVTFRQQFYTE